MYFLAGSGLVKIGITTNLTSRIRSIRNSSPVALDLLATMPGHTVLEGMVHSRFSHLRRHGEWFEDQGEIREYIASLIKQGKVTPLTRSPEIIAEIDRLNTAPPGRGGVA
jgi:hypothetical protein